MNTPNTPSITDPKLLDLAFAPIQTKLESGLSWLDKAFGKCQRLERLLNGKTTIKPSIYVGGNDDRQYLDLFPDSSIGNFCFFDVDDLKEHAWQRNQGGPVMAKVGIVFWFDFRDVYPTDHVNKSVENVIDEILQILKTTRLVVKSHVEQSANIYPRYTIAEIDNQFLMRPFGGFRINCELQINESC